jgi:hypothetical protein
VIVGNVVTPLQVFADERSHEGTLDVKRESGRAVDAVAAVGSLVTALRIGPASLCSSVHDLDRCLAVASKHENAGTVCPVNLPVCLGSSSETNFHAPAKRLRIFVLRSGVPGADCAAAPTLSSIRLKKNSAFIQFFAPKH